jgi:predicted nucleotidyltransferase
VIDGRLPSLARLPQHRELLERAFARLKDAAGAVGLVVGGSLAHGGADFYSDVDLYVVVRDGAFEDIFAERNSTAEAVGSPLFAFDVDPVPGAPQTTSSSTRGRSSSTSCTYVNPTSSPTRSGSAAWC